MVLEESSKALSFAAQQGGDIRKAMVAGQKQYNYSLFDNISYIIYIYIYIYKCGPGHKTVAE